MDSSSRISELVHQLWPDEQEQANEGESATALDVSLKPNKKPENLDEIHRYARFLEFLWEQRDTGKITEDQRAEIEYEDTLIASQAGSVWKPDSPALIPVMSHGLLVMEKKLKEINPVVEAKWQVVKMEFNRELDMS